MTPQPAKRSKRTRSSKGYEYSRGQFITFTKDQLKALDVESSKVIDLEAFVPRGDIDPVYFDARSSRERTSKLDPSTFATGIRRRCCS